MPSRRQEKFSRAVKKAVSYAIAEGLNDPRIEGFVSVTRVEMSADLRNADVYLSIFGGTESSQRKTFSALEHARSRIQAFVAGELNSKFCPVIHLKYDEAFKKILETMRILNEVKQPDAVDV
ncbi:MAG: 30S ribosome-binding factor RbfA [Sedimentisphaerales bacterium]|nr:30S ribosome-binding factor RbfA [Sedimentisphaerales bacterium]